MRKMIYIVLAFFAGFAVMAAYRAIADNQQEPKVVIETTMKSLPYAGLKKQVIENGDTMAYKALLDSMRNDENLSYPLYLYYSLVMANRYQYAPAVADVREALKPIADTAARPVSDISFLLELYF